MGDIEIISLLDKQFMDEYTFETPDRDSNLGTFTQHFRITLADLPNSKHVVSEIQTNLIFQLLRR